LVMVEHIGQVRDAVPGFGGDQLLCAEMLAHQIAEGFGAIGVAALLTDRLKLIHELVIKRDCDALHLLSPSVSQRFSRRGCLAQALSQSL
jgi:hypothetical protein